MSIVNNTQQKNKEIINETILKLDTLDLEYKNTLCQYRDAIIEYSINLKKSKENRTKDSYIQIPQKSFLGASVLDETTGGTIDDCINMCLNNGSCSGATYNSLKKTCWAKSGFSTLIDSTNNGDIAILQATQTSIDTINRLESKLENLRKQKVETLNVIKIPSTELNNNIPQVLLDNENKCYNDKNIYYLDELSNINIDNSLKIDNEYYYTDTKIKSNALIYKFLIFVFIILIIICFYSIML